MAHQYCENSLRSISIQKKKGTRAGTTNTRMVAKCIEGVEVGTASTQMIAKYIEGAESGTSTSQMLAKLNRRCPASIRIHLYSKSYQGSLFTMI